MRSDYNVLSARVDAGFSVDQLRDEYISAVDYSGVYLKVERGFKLDDVQFLEDFPDLRYVELQGKVTDDSWAFRLPETREIILLTRCLVKIPDLAGSKLQRVAIDSRPGLESLAQLTRLGDLTIWLWRGTDFTFLGEQQNLRKLHIEAKRQVTSLDGLDGCPGLEEVELLDVRVTSLAPLGAASGLRRLWILGWHTMSQPVTLYLGDLAGLQELEEIRINHAGHVQSLQPLATFHSLNDFRLRNTEVLDGDLSILSELSKRATVVGPND
jgi:hypothetical protein